MATGFAVRRAALEAGIRALGRMGYRVERGRHLLDREGYLAGTDDDRAADLNAALRRDDVHAVWFARGGYGTARVLERVDWRALRRDSKPLIGYSDLTALFAPAARRAGCCCLYGPVVTELGVRGAFHRPSLRALLRGEKVRIAYRARQVLAPGRAEGRLVGGNLSVLGHLWGTRWAPDLRDAVLFLEDVGEETYRIDRMLTQLASVPGFRRLRGVLLGRFDPPPRRRFPPDRELAQVLDEIFSPLGIPVVRDLIAGHVRGKRTLPLGGTARIDTAARTLWLDPAAPRD